MYVGKTKVAQEHVERFLAFWEELGVRNLQKQDKEQERVDKFLPKTASKAKGTKRIKTR